MLQEGETRQPNSLGLGTSPFDVVGEVFADTEHVFGVTQAEILGNTRTKNIAAARHVAMWVIRQRTEYSLPEIGRRFDNRHHTTVLSAVRKIQREIDQSTPVGKRALLVLGSRRREGE